MALKPFRSGGPECYPQKNHRMHRDVELARHFSIQMITIFSIIYLILNKSYYDHIFTIS